MTTFVLAKACLAADTRLRITRSIFNGNGALINRVHLVQAVRKIRSTPFFVVTGAGDSLVALCCGFLPVFLCLRLFGFSPLPLPCRRPTNRAPEKKDNLLVVWRHGPVWAFNLVVVHVGPLSFVKVSSRLLLSLYQCAVVMGGSGSDTLSLDEAERLGARKSIHHAGRLDPHTSRAHLAFCLKTWAFLPGPMMVPAWPRQLFDHIACLVLTVFQVAPDFPGIEKRTLGTQLWTWMLSTPVRCQRESRTMPTPANPVVGFAEAPKPAPGLA